MPRTITGFARVDKFIARLGGEKGTEPIAHALNLLGIEDGFLVLPNQVVTVVEVSGTDYTTVGYASSQSILSAYQRLLEGITFSFMAYLDVRPINYEESLLRDIGANIAPDDWSRSRYEKFKKGILDYELDDALPVPVVDLRQYIVIPDGEVYFPPRRGLRFWRKPDEINKPERVSAIVAAARETLLSRVDLLISLLREVPMTAHRLDDLEVARLIHLTWREEAAYPEWLRDLSEVTATSEVF